MLVMMQVLVRTCVVPRMGFGHVVYGEGEICVRKLDGRSEEGAVDL